MRLPHALARLLPVAALAACLALPVAAADKKDPAKEQVRRLQAAQRKLEQERNQLAQEKNAAEQKVKEAEAESAEAARRAGAAQRRASGLQQDLEAVKEERETLRGRLAETEKRLSEMIGRQQSTEAERARLQGLLLNATKVANACEDRNERLYEQGRALLRRYEGKSCADALAQREPLTGLAGVRAENEAEDFRDRLEADRPPPRPRMPKAVPDLNH